MNKVLFCSVLKGKNLLPLGSKFFPVRVGPFSEGDKTNLTGLPPLKVYQFPLKTKRSWYMLLSNVTNHFIAATLYGQ